MTVHYMLLSIYHKSDSVTESISYAVVKRHSILQQLPGAAPKFQNCHKCYEICVVTVIFIINKVMKNMNILWGILMTGIGLFTRLGGLLNKW